MYGVIISTRAIIRNERLKIIAKIRDEEGKLFDALIPEREMAALIPRFVLLGEERKADKRLLETIHPIAKRMAEGRRVRLWDYNGSSYLSFLPWKVVHFFSSG